MKEKENLWKCPRLNHAKETELDLVLEGKKRYKGHC